MHEIAVVFFSKAGYMEGIQCGKHATAMPLPLGTLPYVPAGPSHDGAAQSLNFLSALEDRGLCRSPQRGCL